MLAQWLGCAPRGERRGRRRFTVVARLRRGARLRLRRPARTTGSSRSSTWPRPARSGRSRVKVQVTGPLTLGMALHAGGLPAPRAFRRAAEVTRAWSVAVEELVARAAARRRARAVLRRARARVVAARRRAARPRVGHRRAVGRARRRSTASPVCTCAATATSALALEAGPAGARRRGERRSRPRTPSSLARFLDGDGWIAWGAVPTDRPVGESADPHWRTLARVWCELTRRGCDPVPLRTRGLITPACGLAGYGASQAERVLGIARELAARVHDQAVAARLTLGA